MSDLCSHCCLSLFVVQVRFHPAAEAAAEAVKLQRFILSHDKEYSVIFRYINQQISQSKIYILKKNTNHRT
jgi:hypothetical protein